MSGLQSAAGRHFVCRHVIAHPGLFAYKRPRDASTKLRLWQGDIAAMHKTFPLPFAMASWFDAASEFNASFFPAASPASDSPAMTESHETHSLFVPEGASSRGAPMVVMLHGAGQDPDDFAAGTAMNVVAERHGFVVLYPRQGPDHNAQQCWNWFEIAHQSRQDGDPARIAALTQKVSTELHVDKARIYVAGLSAGGAMAALLGELFPEIYAAVGVHSGLAARSGTNLSSALAAMRGGVRADSVPTRMPTIVFHGDMDPIVNPINGSQVMEASFGPPGVLGSKQHTGYKGRGFTRREYLDAEGLVCGEHWIVHDGGHAWSGGRKAGSYADPLGPDASEEMLRFFEFSHRIPSARRQASPCHLLTRIDP